MNDIPLKDGWYESLVDPVRVTLDADSVPDLDHILGLFPRVEGPPAYDPALVAEGVRRLKTTPEVNTGHPFLDLSVKTGLAHIDITFQGDHPKYGVNEYGKSEHDAFPPTIIAAVDALSAWGMTARAATLFGYWLAHFVRDNGAIDYYGPSVSEYGQLLHTAALLDERGGPDGWWQEGFRSLNRMAEHVLTLLSAAETAAGADGLIPGSPEADERDQVARYFHNNAWAAKGLERWADLCERRAAKPSTPIPSIRTSAQRLADATLAVIRATWPADPTDKWLPPQLEPMERPRHITATRAASYTNYRYWPELLSSGLLPPDMANRLVDARLSFGGQFCGMTRFETWVDDWPLADYLQGLWALGRKRDFLLSLYGHVAYHQAKGHLTAYEQVTFPPGKPKASYCLPCQLVAARAARWLVR